MGKGAKKINKLWGVGGEKQRVGEEVVVVGSTPDREKGFSSKKLLLTAIINFYVNDFYGGPCISIKQRGPREQSEKNYQPRG